MYVCMYFVCVTPSWPSDNQLKYNLQLTAEEWHWSKLLLYQDLISPVAMESCTTLTRASSMFDFDHRCSIQTSAAQTNPWSIFKCFSETIKPEDLGNWQLSNLLYRSFDALRQAQNVYLWGVNKREHKKGPIKWFGGTKLGTFPFDTIRGEQKA